MEGEGVDHEIHREEEPVVDHLVVGRGREALLDAGGDGGDHQHQGQAWDGL